MIIKFLQSARVDREPARLSGSAGWNTAAAPQLREASPTRESSVVVAAHLSERDFRLARFAIPALRAFHDYEDWLDFRQGSLWGLEMAGYKVEIIPVNLSAFVIWRRMTSAPPSISALDRFAGLNTAYLVGEQYDEDALQN